MRRLSRVLRQLREEAGLTQDQLARKAGVTEAYISMIEAGKRQWPSVPVLRRLAKAFGIEVGELLK